MLDMSSGEGGITVLRDPSLSVTASGRFFDWLGEEGISLALTTYQVGKLFMFGCRPDGRPSTFERTFNRCMGLCPTPDGNGMYMSGLYEVWRFENVCSKNEALDGYDRVFVPQVSYTTGELDIHDMAVDGSGRLVFVNTQFGCLATLSETHSFRPIWRPSFISGLVPEDRCHLNGMAMQDGRPAFATAVSCSDVLDGWRDHRVGGGVLIDIASDSLVVQGLSMPHSPRWHRGRLWLLNSAAGEFGYVDLDEGRFVPVTFCPGYMRGLYFHGDYALVGVSRPRHNKTFEGLPLEERLRERGVSAVCGVQVVDLRSGEVAHWLRFDGIVEEIYDAIPLVDTRCPMALGFRSDEIRRVISIENFV